MIKCELLHDQGVVVVTPEGSLQSSDFELIKETVDPYIETHGHLNGLMIYTPSFPGWNDFAALISHFKFVKNHHRDILKVAAVTDSKFLSIMPHVANHFVRAEVKHFDYQDKQVALNWLSGDNVS